MPYTVAEIMAEEWPKIMINKAPTKSLKKIRTASKTTAAYWSGKIKLEKKPGWESSNYFVRIQAHGGRRKIKLDCTVRDEAAREAAALYINILAKGWPQVDGARLHLPSGTSLPENPSIEDWVTAVKAKKLVADQSIQKYSESLETIVGEILGIPRARKPELRARIKGFPVASLTKIAITEWLEKRKSSSSTTDVVATRRALNTARSLIINARSLFGDKVLEALKLNSDEIPNIPFRGVKLPSKNHKRYTSRFDAARLLESAFRDLGTADAEDSKFEQWKILYLALVAGLRYREIDQLQVYDMHLAKCLISVSPHQSFTPKNHASIGDVEITEAAAKNLEKLLEQTSGRWFIKEGHSSKSKKYRAGLHHDAVVAWLRKYEERGTKPLADVPKPLHELRKEAGTLVNKAHGLVAAKEFLRHASITTTADLYVDTVGSVTTGLA